MLWTLLLGTVIPAATATVAASTMPHPFWGGLFGALIPGILQLCFAWAHFLKAKAGAIDAAEARAHGELNGRKLDEVFLQLAMLRGKGGHHGS